MRVWKEELLDQRKDSMERKLIRAAEKRQLHFRRISKKAREEETKVSDRDCIHPGKEGERRWMVMEDKFFFGLLMVLCRRMK